MIVAQTDTALEATKNHLLNLAQTHPCFSHPLFAALESRELTVAQAGSILKNYDAHASVLRRLLLHAATLMPEPAVGFVLENVRNEYGNGDYQNNHQFQLQDVAWRSGVTREQYQSFAVQPSIHTFINQVTRFYSPTSEDIKPAMLKSAVSAGAITATEILAIKEFRYLQKAFTRFNQQHHIWFDHVVIEQDHSDESLALALYFIEHHDAMPSVEYGLNGVLDANIHLYDGLLAAIN